MCYRMVVATETQKIESMGVGDNINLEVGLYFLKVTANKKIWYWDKVTGVYNGVAYQVRD